MEVQPREQIMQVSALMEDNPKRPAEEKTADIAQSVLKYLAEV